MTIQNCHFQPLFNTRQQVQFQKNQMNRFTKKSKGLILSLKIPHLPNFGDNKNFSQTFSITFLC